MKPLLEESKDGRDLVTLSVRVERDTFNRFKVACEREYRPMAAELRRMVEERVAGVELEQAA